MRTSTKALLATTLAAVTLTAGCAQGPSNEHPGGTSGSTDVSASDYHPPQLAGYVRIKDLKESSGLSASDCQDVLWTHNDSGNDPNVYGLSTAGKHLGTWQVTGARNVDWESMTSFRDPSGQCWLVVADIGDNDQERSDLQLYRFPEPVVSAASGTTTLQATAPAQAMRFRYPDGAHNAETIFGHPRTGDLYVVTKEESGPAGVYRVRPAFGSSAIAQKVAEVTIPSDPEGRITDGSMSPDGTRVMLCDEAGGYELVLPAGSTDPDSIWRQQPKRVDLGDRPQGEAVSYSRDGSSLYASSEKKNAPLYVIKMKS
jgi:hypothetical protein